MEFLSYEVGKTIPEFAGHSESTVFDIDNTGATLKIFFNRPTPDEIKQFQSGKSFEIRFLQLRNVIMVMTKCGNLNYMDSPYTPHLSKNLTELQVPKNSQGLGLRIILIDGLSGTICAMRLVGLSEKFTKSFFKTIEGCKNEPWNKKEYDANLNRIFRTYRTSELVKMARDYCKIN